MYFIEYNGKQHYESVEYFGGKKSFELQKKRDSYVRGFVSRHREKLSLLEISYKLKSDTIENKILEFLKITKFAPINSNINSKSEELLEGCNANQQPSTPLTKCEGSETNS